jgi:hypothetical protein
VPGVVQQRIDAWAIPKGKNNYESTPVEYAALPLLGFNGAGGKDENTKKRAPHKNSWANKRI